MIHVFSPRYQSRGWPTQARRRLSQLAGRLIQYVGWYEMSLVTFHCFNDGDVVFLARQVEVGERPTPQSPIWSREENLKILLGRANELGVRSYFEKAAALIRNDTDAYEWPGRKGYSYSFPEPSKAGTPSAHQYLSISIPGSPKGAIVLRLRERAIVAAGPEWEAVSRAWGRRVLKSEGDAEVTIHSDDDWKSLEPDVKRLCAAIVEGRKSLLENSLQEEKAVIEREGAAGLPDAQT